MFDYLYQLEGTISLANKSPLPASTPDLPAD
jgi:hypothetical protein